MPPTVPSLLPGEGICRCAPKFKSKSRVLRLFTANDLCTRCNLVDHGLSQLHIHSDAKALLPAMVSGLNPSGSKRQWKGGEQVLVEGCTKIKHSGRDVVLVNGSQLHGVLPVQPACRSHCAMMFSVVHFSRCENKDGLWKDVPHSPEPACQG